MMFSFLLVLIMTMNIKLFSVVLLLVVQQLQPAHSVMYTANDLQRAYESGLAAGQRSTDGSAGGMYSGGCAAEADGALGSEPQLQPPFDVQWKNVRLSFTTPILEVPWTDKEAEANAAALDAILQAYKTNASASAEFLMNGAWHSGDLLKWSPLSPVHGLEHSILRKAGQMLKMEVGSVGTDIKVMLMAWGLVLPSGAWLAPHRHTGAHTAHYSGFAVLSNPADANEPSLVMMESPLSHSLNHWPSRLEYELGRNTFLAFPSYLQTWTQPHEGSTLLVLLGYNIKVIDTAPTPKADMNSRIHCLNCMAGVLVPE